MVCGGLSSKCISRGLSVRVNRDPERNTAVKKASRDQNVIHFTECLLAWPEVAHKV